MATTDLHNACFNGDLGIIQNIIKTIGGALNPKDKDGMTPLHLVCQKGHTAVVDLLIKTKGVDLNPQDKDGWTPFHWACYNGNTSVVDLFIMTIGVDLNPKDKYGRTPFHKACEKGHTAVVDLLIKTKRVDLNPKDKGGRSPLALAHSRNHVLIVDLLTKVLSNNAEEEKLFLTKVEEMIETEAGDLNSKDEDGRTFFHHACDKGYTSVMELLIKTEGVDLNAKDKNGITPFILACEKMHVPVVELLIKTKGVDFYADKLKSFSSLLFFNIVLKFDEIDVTSAFEGCYSDMKCEDTLLTKEEEEILAREHTIAFIDHRGMDIFMTAAHIGYFPIVEFFLFKEMKEKININQVDKLKRSALMHACYRGHKKCVLLLLSQHPKIEAKDRDGMNALMYAVMGGHLEIMEMLLEHDASYVNATNTWLRSAKGVAKKYISNRKKKEEMLTLLFKYEKKWCCQSLGEVNAREATKLLIENSNNKANSNEINGKHTVNEMMNPLIKIECRKGDSFIAKMPQYKFKNAMLANLSEDYEYGDDSNKVDESGEGCKAKLCHALCWPFKCIIRKCTALIDFVGSSKPLTYIENLCFEWIQGFGQIALGDEPSSSNCWMLSCFCCVFFLLPLLFLPWFLRRGGVDVSGSSDDSKQSSFNFRRITPLMLFVLFSVAPAIVSVTLSLNNWNHLYHQNYTSNVITIEPISCFTIHGTNLQPYWMVAILSIFGQIMNSISLFFIKYCTTNESFNLTKPSQVGARLNKLYGWMQLITYITICSNLDKSFGRNIPPSDPDTLFSLMHEVNGSTSIDVTWLLNTASNAPQGWRLYEQLYIRCLCGGVGMFLFTSYSNMVTYKLTIFDVEHLTYLNKIEFSKIGFGILLLLPALITHIAPMMIMFPHYILSMYGIWWIVNKILEKLLYYCECFFVLPFIIKALKKVTFAFTLTLIFQTLFVWAVLVYSLPFPISPSQYLSILWMELSMRNTKCYIQPYVNDFNRYESLACAHGVASAVSCNKNIGANEIANLLSWMFSG